MSEFVNRIPFDGSKNTQYNLLAEVLFLRLILKFLLSIVFLLFCKRYYVLIWFLYFPLFFVPFFYILYNNIFCVICNLQTIKQAISDWYFDRSSFHEVDTQNDLPRNCSNPFFDLEFFYQRCLDVVRPFGSNKLRICSSWCMAHYKADSQSWYLFYTTDIDLIICFFF